ncbi:hypothetical protein K6V98_00280 [Collinsella sp. AGMB00827]|uniref:Flavodoxin domain-containing protein n=1 Tax=Collinsella ureilytica TaxID=2869515 RepID=A0ABS7MHU5_9ACTN|nr:flavodoxin domain-containing protein [Collinsella urealyticum]MBY4796807.1 hypothetical protein [Collinsella urealyticum]
MKTIILYRSKHRGNTKKLVDAIAAFDKGVETLDIATLGKDEYPDLSSYRLIGVASGIYYGHFDRDLKRVLEHSLSYGDKIFGLMTYGGANKWYGRDLVAVCQLKMASVLTMYGCRGFDSWGLFRLFGGIGVGHPNEEDIQGAVDFYARLREDYEEILEQEWQARSRRLAQEAAHPRRGFFSNLVHRVTSRFSNRKEEPRG